MLGTIVTIKFNYLLVMVPEYVGRRLGAELHSASEIYGAAFINMKVRSAKYGRRWHCQQETPMKNSRRVTEKNKNGKRNEMRLCIERMGGIGKRNAVKTSQTRAKLTGRPHR